MNKTSLYKFIKRTPDNEEFAKSVYGVALLLKKSKVDERIAIINAVSGEPIWVTTGIQRETRSDDKKLLTIETRNTVYEFEMIAETI